MKCQQWMKPFYEVLSESLSALSVPTSSSISADETYSIQIHNVSMDLLVSLFSFIILKFLLKFIYFTFLSKLNVNDKRSKFLSSIVNIKPFRDLINNISWSSKLSGKQKNNEEEQINKNTIVL